jgi:pimeloyl-ACP methyl ester carboxylesterase
MMLAGLGLYLAYGAGMVAFHTSFIYPFSQGEWPLPKAYAQVDLPSRAPARMRVAMGQGPAVLYFMGNAGSIGLFGVALEQHRRAGRTVVALEYRGGGGLPGWPSEKLLKEDALAAYDWLDAQGDQPIVVHGYSLGSGLAMHVAANRPVQGVILDAPFARLCELMAKASALPACWLPVQRWDSLTLVDSIQAPVLIQHGAKDVLIPPQQGERLAEDLESKGQQVEFHLLPEADHLDLAEFPEWGAAIEGFLR